MLWAQRREAVMLTVDLPGTLRGATAKGLDFVDVLQTISGALTKIKFCIRWIVHLTFSDVLRNLRMVSNQQDLFVA